jgi:glycosyltransferase involved in cell wall biosynthesis
MKDINLIPKVSVYVVSYNHENYLRECLQSVVTQKCNFDFEVIVAEDCSTDSTRDIIEEFTLKFPNIIKAIYQEHNIGLHENIAKTINECSGEYIAYIDGDDYMLPGKLQKQINFFEAHEDCSMVFHNLRMIGDKLKKNAYNNPLTEKECIVNIDTFVENGLAHWGTSSKMFRKDSLPKEGFLKELKCIGDQHFNFQISRCGKVGYISEVLGCYRKHENGISQLNKLKSKIECAIKDLILTYNCAFDYGVKKTIVDKRQSFVYYDGACQYLMLQDYKMFKFYIEKSYENNIFFNKKHKLCFTLRNFPQILHTLKILNNFLYDIKGKQRI